MEEQKNYRIRILIYIALILIVLGIFAVNFYKERNWSAKFNMGCVEYDALTLQDLEIAKDCYISVSNCTETDDTKKYSKEMNIGVDKCFCLNGNSFYRVCVSKAEARKIDLSSIRDKYSSLLSRRENELCDLNSTLCKGGAI